MIPYQPEVYESVLTEMLLEAGVILNAEIHNASGERWFKFSGFSSNGNSETTKASYSRTQQECIYCYNG